jgi:hypothetical protein
LQGDAEANFDGEEAVGGGLSEDAEGFAQVEGFADDRGGVDLETCKGEFLLVGGEESCFVAVFGEVPEGEEGDYVTLVLS